ncbi:short chain dehydrogenase [Stagonosporopsis vannaccii]|nr:short chain dehydrogenase [Stagonosporopsis vannaccii]
MHSTHRGLSTAKQARHYHYWRSPEPPHHLTLSDKCYEGSGVGHATAIAFTIAGSERPVLIGRTLSTLEKRVTLLPTGPRVEVYALVVTDETKAREAAERVGKWDALILGEARTISFSSSADAEMEEWWKQYEVSVKSVVVTVKAFVPLANSGAHVLGTSSSTLLMGPSFTPGLSAYNTAKIAQVKVLDFLATEMKAANVISVYPGTIDTNTFKSSGADAKELPMDTVELAAHFLVWWSQPKTKYLSGRLVWANWDVDELNAKAEDIKASQTKKIMYERWEDWASRAGP